MFLQGEVMLHFVQSRNTQERIIHACHTDATAGHMGKTCTMYRIKERFMWHGMEKDVNKLVSNDICICRIRAQLLSILG